MLCLLCLAAGWEEQIAIASIPAPTEATEIDEGYNCGDALHFSDNRCGNTNICSNPCSLVEDE